MDVNAKEKDTMATFECETNEPFIKVKWMKSNEQIDPKRRKVSGKFSQLAVKRYLLHFPIKKTKL